MLSNYELPAPVLLAVSEIGVRADETDRLLGALTPLLERFRDTRERRESLVLLRAVRLAPSLEVCEAILRRERVPKSRLDPLWTERYGL